MLILANRFEGINRENYIDFHIQFGFVKHTPHALNPYLSQGNCKKKKNLSILASCKIHGLLYVKQLRNVKVPNPSWIIKEDKSNQI